MHNLYGDHLQNHISNPGLVNDSTLHVIGVVSNFSRFHSRYRLFRKWKEEMENTPNVKLYIVETAFGDRHHEITEEGNPCHLQLRTNSEAWVKESMVNLGVKRLLPLDWRYVAWIDGDVHFRNPGWALETIHQLQHFSVVQPWSDCVDLGPHGEILQHFKSFGWAHQRRLPKQKHPSQKYLTYAHTGYAVACTRSFWENVGGLPPFCILGSGDHHLAFGCIGEIKDTIHGKMSQSFHRKLFEWERTAIQITHGEVGFVPGRIEHFFHGAKKRRKYRERWEILYSNGYDPDKHLMYDHQGLVQLIGHPKLEQDIHMYNLERLEDSTDTY